MEDGRRLAAEAYNIACRIEQKELQLAGLDLHGLDSVAKPNQLSQADLLQEITDLKQIFFDLTGNPEGQVNTIGVT
jgi:hypothetical protein